VLAETSAAGAKSASTGHTVLAIPHHSSTPANHPCQQMGHPNYQEQEPELDDLYAGANDGGGNMATKLLRISLTLHVTHSLDSQPFAGPHPEFGYPTEEFSTPGTPNCEQRK